MLSNDHFSAPKKDFTRHPVDSSSPPDASIYIQSDCKKAAQEALSGPPSGLSQAMTLLCLFQEPGGCLRATLSCALLQAMADDTGSRIPRSLQVEVTPRQLYSHRPFFSIMRPPHHISGSARRSRILLVRPVCQSACSTLALGLVSYGIIGDTEELRL